MWPKIWRALCSARSVLIVFFVGGLSVFPKLKTRNTKKRSTLDKQRVKKDSNKSKWADALSWSAAAKCLILVLVLTVFWGLGLRVLDRFHAMVGYFNSVLVLAPKDWRLEVQSETGAPLPEDIRRDVFAVAHKLLRFGSPDELRALARQVESMGTLENVRVIRPLANTVIFSASIRKAALLVLVGSRTRYLTLDATVFGDDAVPNESPLWVRPTAIVTGIFDQTPTPAFDQSMKLILTPEQSRHLAEAVDVWQQVSAAHVDVKSINFRKFRGFAISTPDDTEIVIGVMPFDYKLKKLRGLLDGLKRDGTVAERIELDYEGKAFVKERKL